MEESAQRANDLFTVFLLIASDFVLSNPDVPFNEDDIRQMTQEIKDNYLAFSAFRAGVTGADEGCGISVSLSMPDSGMSDNSSTGCRNIVFQVSTDWNVAVIDHDEISFDGTSASFSITGNGSLIFGIAQFPSDWLYSGLNDVMMRRINEVISAENGTQDSQDDQPDEDRGDASDKDNDDGETDADSDKATDELTADAGEMTLHFIHENGDPFDKGTAAEAEEMDKAPADEFRKAVRDETGRKKISDFSPYQVTFRKADGSAYTLWHLILEAESADEHSMIAVMTRDGKVRISEKPSQGLVKLSADTITAVAAFSEG